ncbi:MAG TPA: serine/threonine-protein kinase, partial [Methanobacteriaceae archaeon]|nr:serine/threonine-protein kinase [Methanobacteriaceae archaeon]
HQKNIIHGDIKTSNIMIKNGVYKISDWGLSKITTDGSVTLSGATPQYAAPEQISREFGRSDERTDIYQLGTVFYELLTGKVPFEGEMSEIYGSILTSQATPPSEINPESAALEPIVMKCLSKVKDERYSSMIELQEDLEEYYTPINMDETLVFKKEPDNGRS